ncbi:MAG: hypothetical protein ACNA7V_11175 [Bacteroidales bacterium]
MKSSFTLNDLILFALNDTLEVEAGHLTEEMKPNDLFAKEWRCIFEHHPYENQTCFSSDSARTANIIAYSKALQVFGTQSIGSIYKVMN